MRVIIHQQSREDMMLKAGDDCSRKVLASLPAILRNIDTEYGRKEVGSLLQYEFEEDIPKIYIPNYDWNRDDAKKDYSDIIRLLKDDVGYEIDRIWGFEEPLLPSHRPESRGEEIAQSLVKPFMEQRDQFFKELGDDMRYRERYNSQKAFNDALSLFDSCMKYEAKELLE